MAKAILTQDQIDFIHANYLKGSNQDLADQLGLTEGIVMRFKKKAGLIVPYELSRKFAGLKMRGRTISTPELDNKIKQFYLEVPIKTLAKKLNVGESLLNGRMRQLNLIVPEEIIKQRKLDSRIKKGNVPPNKGRKQIDYMTPEQIERCAKTRWKKGNLPHNTYNEIGKIVTRKDSKGKLYKHICLSLGKWELYHKYVWEQTNGPIPKGFCLWFLNGNQQDVILDNLELITRAENLARNNMSDSAIAAKIAAVGRGNVDQELKAEIIKHPELIELKRQQLKLQRAIKDGRK